MVRDTTNDAAYYDRVIADREDDLRTSAAALAAGKFAPSSGYDTVREGRLWDLAVLRYSRARAQLLNEYVERWLSKMRGPRFGPPMLRDLNYIGYWCFEAAAVAVLSATPDAAFRDHPRYPRA